MPAKNYNQYMAIYMLNRYHERMAEALRLLGGRCVSCGLVNNLELDHIDRREKAFTIAKLWSVSRSRFLEELKKCQILCRVCHQIKTDSETVKSAHGTENRYLKYKCRCLPCKQNMSRLRKDRRNLVGA